MSLAELVEEKRIGALPNKFLTKFQRKGWGIG